MILNRSVLYLEALAQQKCLENSCHLLYMTVRCLLQILRLCNPWNKVHLAVVSRLARPTGTFGHPSGNSHTIWMLEIMAVAPIHSSVCQYRFLFEILKIETIFNLHLYLVNRCISHFISPTAERPAWVLKFGVNAEF